MSDEAFASSEDAARWSNVLARITPARALSIDSELSDFDPQSAATPGRILFPEDSGIPVLDEQSNGRPAIGVMVSNGDANIEALAARLAALAIEKDCEVIALTQNPLSGLERFGFRTERIAGDTDEKREECLEQIRRFWRLEIII